MLIAADARFLDSPEMPVYQAFTEKLLLQLAKDHPSDQFIFFVDKPVELLTTVVPTNVLRVAITPKPKNYWTHKWWYDVRLPLALKKYKPAVFIGSYGLCSCNTSVSQILIVHDLAFRHKYAAHPHHSFLFYKKSTPICLKKAAAIVAVSQSIKEELAIAYPISQKKITVCGSASDSGYTFLEWAGKEHTKEKYTQGCEYFLCRISDNTKSQFIHVLKAFAIFKKWQRSNMKLLLVVESMLLIQPEKAKLETYRFRNDVVLIEELSLVESQSLIASAYASIHPVLYEGFSTEILEAMLCGTPVMAYDTPSAKEMAGDSALYISPTNAQQAADQMKIIYKDENLRNQLIKSGFEKTAHYSWQKTEASIRKVIESLRQKE